LIVGFLFWSSYRQIVRVFKWITLVLLAYVVTAFFARVDWHEAVMATLQPRLAWSREYLAVLVGILGTTISPYLFFWQASQEVEEERSHRCDSACSWLDQNRNCEAGRGSTSPVSGKRGVPALHIRIDRYGHAGSPRAGGIVRIRRRLRGEVHWRSAEREAILRCARHSNDDGPRDQLRGPGCSQSVVLVRSPLILLILLLTSNHQLMGDRVNSRALQIAGWITLVVMAAAAIGMFIT
jgi:hypothetical protein